MKDCIRRHSWLLFNLIVLIIVINFSSLRSHCGLLTVYQTWLSGFSSNWLNRKEGYVWTTRFQRVQLRILRSYRLIGKRTQLSFSDCVTIVGLRLKWGKQLFFFPSWWRNHFDRFNLWLVYSDQTSLFILIIMRDQVIVETWIDICIILIHMIIVMIHLVQRIHVLC